MIEKFCSIVSLSLDFELIITFVSAAKAAGSRTHAADTVPT
jgi:hypothetical protein